MRNRWCLGALVLAACNAPEVMPPADRCLEPMPTEGVVVAQVGHVKISVDQVLHKLEARGPSVARRYRTADRMRQLVEDQIRFELLVRAAQERGLDRDPDVVDAARRVMVRKLLQHDLGATVFADEVGAQSIEAYYDAHIEEYRQPEKRRIGEIELEPTEDGRAFAQSLLTRIKQSADDRATFRTLASRYSRNPETRPKGGEQLFASESELAQRYGQSFAHEVFTADPQTLIDQPVQSTRGWHVVRVIARRESLLRTLNEVRDEIVDKLLSGERAKQFGAYIEEIKRRYPVAIYEEQLPLLLAEERINEKSSR